MVSINEIKTRLTRGWRGILNIVHSCQIDVCRDIFYMGQEFSKHIVVNINVMEYTT